MHRVAWSAPPGTDWNKVRTHLCVLFLLSVGSAHAQAARCSVVAYAMEEQVPRELTAIPWPPPANGYGYPPALRIPLRGLSSESFVVRDGKRPVPVLSVEEDTGPRRIALVVALDRRWGTRFHGGLGEAARTAVTAVLSNARPEDSFALITAAGPRIAVPFGAPASELLARTTQLSPSQTPLGRAEAVLSALIEVADWFGRSQTGDSILLIGGFRKASKARVLQVAKMLVSRGIRVFVLGGTSDYVNCLDTLCVEQSPDVTLAVATGGANQEMGYAGPKHPDESVRLWQDEAKSLYDVATMAYTVRLPSTGPRMTMRLSLGPGVLTYPAPLGPGLAADLSKAGVGAHLTYPRPLPVCP